MELPPPPHPPLLFPCNHNKTGQLCEMTLWRRRGVRGEEVGFFLYFQFTGLAGVNTPNIFGAMWLIAGGLWVRAEKIA